ncbi:hypothetical protein HF521_022658 [Silurus meridionalis]|uniref:Transmembrane protein 44 n=3 Tax=Silurus meridionalis TaxID=175797 RepID=A0A8T0B9X1_SILME|nr:hypothetical protein HF521_022658 [Silurus meridionalis]
MMLKTDFPTAFSRWWKEVTSSFSFNVGIATALCFTSALFLLMSYFLLTWSRSKTTRDAAVCVLYSLIGDLCHLAGAFLSNQTLLQCGMGSLMTSLDLLRFISITLPLCCWYYSTTGRRARRISRRRRQNFLVLWLLFGVGGCVYSDIRLRHTQTASYDSPTSRRLLGVIVHDPIELLGYALGLLAFAISWTSRIPFFLKANRGEMSSQMQVTSRGFSASAGALYAAAILLYDLRLEPVVKALPWILSGACWAILDVSILLLTCYRMCSKRQSVERLDSDTQSLLGRVTYGPSQSPKDRHISCKSRSSKMPDMGPNRNSNVQPIRKVCLKEVTITRENSADNQPLIGSVKVVRVDECYSSGSATDSSSIRSELEWDFEETPSQWSSPNRDGQKMDAFPLQEWTVDRSSKSNPDLDERIVPESHDLNAPGLSEIVK